MTLASPPAAARVPEGVEPGVARGSGSGGGSVLLMDPVREIDGVTEYLSTLEENRNKLVILKIFAPWCRSCRAVTPKVNRLAREFSDILFVKMDYERNKDLCKRLGVRIMPTFIFYWGAAGEVEKFSCGPARAGIIREKIEDIIKGQCELPEAALADGNI